MNIYNASDIANTEIAPPQMIVQELLPVGLSTLAGAPKLGKSFLSLSLAYSVAQGIPFLNHPTSQGDSLYVDLEGSEYRIKERLEMMGYDFPSTLHITHEARAMGKGLIEDIDEWWSSTPMPRLVIIDTISRLKSAGHVTFNSQENDTRAYAPLQKYALEKQIAILCVTHLKKDNPFRATDADWIERITGSMGLAGCCDSIWGLFRKRGDNIGYLRTTARDIDAGDMVCRFDNGLWSLESDDVAEYEFKEKPIIKFISHITCFYGGAEDLLNQYMDFCKEQGIPHGLSEGNSLLSFGKQLKTLMPQMWRINKLVSRTRDKDGVHYSISTNG